MAANVWGDVRKALLSQDGRDAVKTMVKDALPWVLTFWPQGRAIVSIVVVALPLIEKILDVLGYDVSPKTSGDPVVISSPVHMGALAAVTESKRLVTGASNTRDDGIEFLGEIDEVA